MNKIMLAYSGGLDTSCILTWLKETYQVPIIAYCANVGQDDDFHKIYDKAKSTGADDCIIDDLQESFVENYIFPAIQANAIYEGVYLMGTSLSRPCIAKGLVNAALEHGCDAIAHGSTGKGNDQIRFELAAKTLSPQLTILAPWRQWSFNSRSDLFDYAFEHGIPLPVTKDKPYSIDANLMHISYEGGILEDPWAAPPEDMFLWTASPEKAPDIAEFVDINFEHGIPTAINGKPLSPVALLHEINSLAAKHGVGRVDLVENRYIGIKSRGVYETPGTTVLMQAHKAVESITLDKEITHLNEELSLKLSKLIYNGYWFAPETQLLLEAIAKSQQLVTGVAKMKLYKGNCAVVGRQSPKPLYDAHTTSFEDMTAFNPNDCTGFINIAGLRLKAWSQYAGIEKRIQASA